MIPEVGLSDDKLNEVVKSPLPTLKSLMHQ